MFRQIRLVMCLALILLLATPGLAQDKPKDTKPNDLIQESVKVAKNTAKSRVDVPVPAVNDPSVKLRSIYLNIQGMEALTVSFKDGVVTLKGQVPSAKMRDEATKLAEKMDGVLYVQPLIDIKEAETPSKAEPGQAQVRQDEEVQSKLRAIFADVPNFKQVKVNVSAGVVHLTGRVPTKESQTQVEALAQKIDGVVYVDNQTAELTEVSERISPAVSKAKQLLKTTISKLPLYGLGLVIFFFFWWLSGAIGRWDWPFRRWQDKPLVREILRQIVRTVVFVTGILIILELLGITTLVGAVLGTAGVAGVALGFAFRDIVENYLASVLLSLRQPFRKGDFIQIDTHMGSVMRMTTRDTVLMTSDGNHVRIPNAQVFKSVLYNYSLNPNRRFDFVVGVGVGESLKHVKEIALSALERMDGILEDPAPFMVIDDLGDFSVLCHFYAWIDQRSHDRNAVRSEAIRRTKLALEKDGVDMPEPTQRRYIYQMPTQTPELSNDSPRQIAREEEIEDNSWEKEATEHSQVKSQVSKDTGLEHEPDLLSDE